MIARLREEHTLDALNALVTHLEVLRPERKFVMVFTEGWPLYPSRHVVSRVARRTGCRRGSARRRSAHRRPAPSRARSIRDRQPDARKPAIASGRCSPYTDHEIDFRELLQRANRANVSFYPIDARGLVVFDTPIEWGVPPAVDAAWLRKR